MKHFNIIVVIFLILSGTNSVYAKTFESQSNKIKNNRNITWINENTVQCSIYSMHDNQPKLLSKVKNISLNKDIFIAGKITCLDGYCNSQNSCLNWVIEELRDYGNWNPPEPNDIWLDIENYRLSSDAFKANDPEKWYDVNPGFNIHSYISKHDLTQKNFRTPKVASIFLLGVTVLGVIGKLTHRHLSF